MRETFVDGSWTISVPLATGKTPKARIFKRNGVWYSLHVHASKPGLGNTPEQAFRRMFLQLGPAISKCFLEVMSI